MFGISPTFLNPGVLGSPGREGDRERYCVLNTIPMYHGVWDIIPRCGYGHAQSCYPTVERHRKSERESERERERERERESERERARERERGDTERLHSMILLDSQVGG